MPIIKYPRTKQHINVTPGRQIYGKIYSFTKPLLTSFTDMSAAGMLRANEHSNDIANCAVLTVLPPGVFMTIMPFLEVKNGMHDHRNMLKRIRDTLSVTGVSKTRLRYYEHRFYCW